MGSKDLYKNYDSVNVSAFGATAPSGFTLSDKLPTGDRLLYEVYLLLNLVLTIGTGATPATDGELLLEDSIYLETDKHGAVIDGVDALGLHRLQQFQQGTRPSKDAVAAASATYKVALRLPLAFSNGYKPYDTALDMYRARPLLKIGFNALDKALGSVGTATVAPAIDVSALTVESPLVNADPLLSEVPQAVMPYISVKKETISAAETGRRIQMTYGDRDYLYIGVSQRNSSTLAELANTVIADSGRISLDVAGYSPFDKLAWREIQGINKSHYSLETQPTGWGLLDFYSKRGRLTNVIETAGKQGNMFLVADVLAPSNAALWIYSICVKAIPVGARR
jgi:hypothetical protein